MNSKFISYFNNGNTKALSHVRPFKRFSTTVPNQSPVLIVGGSLVGLSAALVFRSQGVPTVLVEKHLESSPHPRAIGFTQRTMEIYNQVGLVSQIPQVPPNHRLVRVKAESLTGKWKDESSWTPGPQGIKNLEFSPYTGAAIAQDKLEPLLRKKAIELGADVRVGVELVEFKQDSNGVKVLVRKLDGEEYEISASYMVAADGNRSSVREKLGIKMEGYGHLRTLRSVLFRANLEEYRKKDVNQFEIDNPHMKAFLTTYGDRRWVLMFHDDIERDENTLRTMINHAIGREDLDVEIVTTGRWELGAKIADQFSKGRIFLAGDSAHTLPPNRGGYGANTGIEDVHNLGWKLKSVLSGKSSEDLLNTYDLERRPIAWLRYNQIFSRPDYKKFVKNPPQTEILDEMAIELGQSYNSGAIISDSKGKIQPALLPDEWKGQPGTRAPHLWLNKNDEKISTLDLFKGSWVLVTDDPEWIKTTKEVSEKLKEIDLECICGGEGFKTIEVKSLGEAFGLEFGGASLVRPDGYIAWRTVRRTENNVNSLIDGLKKATFSL